MHMFPPVPIIFPLRTHMFEYVPIMFPFFPIESYSSHMEVYPQIIQVMDDQFSIETYGDD